jgi:hypothetical protein
LVENAGKHEGRKKKERDCSPYQFMPVSLMLYCVSLRSVPFSTGGGKRGENEERK